MSIFQKSWSVTLGIALGAVLGVIVSKSMDRWGTPALADGREGRKAMVTHSETFRFAAKAIAPAVVNITNMKHVRVAVGGGRAYDELGIPFYRPPQIKEGMAPKGVGSGFIFDSKNGFILTNNHVVDGGDQFVVRLSDKREVEAKLIGVDPQTDVAVLKIDVGNLVAAQLGNSDVTEVGDWVLACGNPFGLLEQTVTAGIISAKGRKGIGLTNYEDFLQTDAAINMGNSGGPLVNLDGEVIGMNSAIYSKTGGYQGIGFAIPINQAKKIAEQLIRNGAVVRGWMGVKVKDSATGTLDSGAIVDGVYLNSPARKAGILPGDVLLRIDDKPIRNSNDIPAIVADMQPGATVHIHGLRKEKEEVFKVTIGVQPKDWGTKKDAD